MEQCGDMRENYRRRLAAGMGYGDLINFAYELQQAVLRDRERLAELQNGGSAEEIAGLKKCIMQNENLLRDINSDLHGVTGI